MIPTCSTVKNRPTDVISQSLVVEDEFANCLRELIALPTALASPGAVALSFWRGSTHGLDRIGGRTQLVRGDVRDSRRLSGRVRGMTRCTMQISGRCHRMAARRASLCHRGLAACPGADLLDCLTWSRVISPIRLEEVKDVLGAARRPQREKSMVHIGQGPTAADRHEPGVADFREDHRVHPSVLADRSGADPHYTSIFVVHADGTGGA